MNPRYIVETGKSPAQASSDLQAALKGHGFGVLHSYDLRATLAAKGFGMTNECLILEVCSPRQAAAVLAEDMGMNLALPCRISVYQDGGRTFIGMIRPVALLSSLSTSDVLGRIAAEVERDMVAVIDAAR
jgi:uncharacterized protein (DUF302 family)